MCYVYIIRSGLEGQYKIGISKHVDQRIETLQKGNPIKIYELLRLGFFDVSEAFNVEQNLHEIFSESRIRGEWFRSSIDLRKAYEYFIQHRESQLVIKENPNKIFIPAKVGEQYWDYHDRVNRELLACQI